MQSKKQYSIFGNFSKTPHKQSHSSFPIDNSLRIFTNNFKHRKPIFGYSFKSNNNLNSLKLSFDQPKKESLSFYQISNALNDDFCGCEATLRTCKRIIVHYFNNLSFQELETYYSKTPKCIKPISEVKKKQLFSQLPIEYPEIYHSQLSSILERLDASTMTKQKFMLLAWVQFHCKVQYVTYYFFLDFKESLNIGKFYSKLKIILNSYQQSFQEKNRFYTKLGFQISNFLDSFHESGGANLIPVTQYAKFLEIYKQKGQRALVQMIILFMTKKKTEFFQILKYWTQKKLSNLIQYSRFLNWDLFFEQIKDRHN